MGKPNRSGRRFSKPAEQIKLIVQDVVEVTEEQQAVMETPPIVPAVNPQPRPSAAYNPNSANNLLNSILTTLLTQEYKRLQQQLMNIKQQLDAQNLVTESLPEPPPLEEPTPKSSEEPSLDENDDFRHNERNEAKLLSVSASQQETNE